MRTGALSSVHENVVANSFSSGRDRRPGRFSIVIAVSFSIVIAVSFAASIHGTADAAFFLSAAHAETGATKVSVPEPCICSRYSHEYCAETRRSC
jgi:hypothetical protein